jgi:hypothetical protein
METLTFDTNGYITPSEKITVDLETLQHYFVDNFPNSTTRKVLFDNYLRYVDAFAREITPHFTQWINGSFVTQKENPKDIDFVTFIAADIYIVKEKFIEKYWTTQTYDIGLDAWLLKIYPNTVKEYQQYLDYKEEWFLRFTRTRKDDYGNHLKKGFLEIKHNFNGK